MKDDLISVASAIVAVLVWGVLCMFLAGEAFGATGSDFQCGPYRVKLEQQQGEELHAVVNGGAPLVFEGTMLDGEANYVHQFGDAELRVTTKGRVAFRPMQLSRWNACQVLVMYADQTDTR